MKSIQFTAQKTGFRNLISFGVPILIIISSIFIVKSSLFKLNSSALSIGITFDLLIIAPLVYFLLIRKSKISKKTVYTLFIACTYIATLVLPKENQQLLTFVFHYILPFFELFVLFFLILRIRKAQAVFKQNKKKSQDVFTIIKSTFQELFPRRFASFLATEIGTFYYGLFCWRKVSVMQNEYAYHKNTGIIAILYALILMIGVETFALHLLIAQWSIMASWIASFLSVYSALLVFGFIKSIQRRFISIENDVVHLRFGILAETTILLTDIVSIENYSKDIKVESGTIKMSPLGDLVSHNVLISLNKEYALVGLYGKRKLFNKIVFSVDNNTEFVNFLENYIMNLKFKL